MNGPAPALAEQRIIDRMRSPVKPPGTPGPCLIDAVDVCCTERLIEIHVHSGGQSSLAHTEVIAGRDELLPVAGVDIEHQPLAAASGGNDRGREFQRIRQRDHAVL